jgi:hypothetical protein
MARKWIAALTIVLAAGFAGSAVAHAAISGVTVAATFNGQDIARASTVEPVRLEPGTLAKVALDVTNKGKDAVVVKRVELSGDILGLSFYRYVASTELTVQPGTTGKLSYQVDLTDLDRQATGLIRGDLKVTDEAGRVIATIPTVTDVRGSLWSITGLFGVFLILFTALTLLGVILAVARHRLPANRGLRGLRFLLPGIGIALVLGFTASVLRLWVPTTEVWLAAAGILAFVLFALGYFSPMPGDEDEDEDYFDDGDYDQYTDGYGYDPSTDELGYDPSTDDHADVQTTDEHAEVQTTEERGDDKRYAITVGNVGTDESDESDP